MDCPTILNLWIKDLSKQNFGPEVKSIRSPGISMTCHYHGLNFWFFSAHHPKSQVIWMIPRKHLNMRLMMNWTLLCYCKHFINQWEVRALQGSSQSDQFWSYNSQDQFCSWTCSVFLDSTWQVSSFLFIDGTVCK